MRRAIETFSQVDYASLAPTAHSRERHYYIGKYCAHFEFGSEQRSQKRRTPGRCRAGSRLVTAQVRSHGYKRGQRQDKSCLASNGTHRSLNQCHCKLFVAPQHVHSQSPTVGHIQRDHANLAAEQSREGFGKSVFERPTNQRGENFRFHWSKRRLLNSSVTGRLRLGRF